MLKEGRMRVTKTDPGRNSHPSSGVVAAHSGSHHDGNAATRSQLFTLMLGSPIKAVPGGQGHAKGGTALTVARWNCQVLLSRQTHERLGGRPPLGGSRGNSGSFGPFWSLR